MKTLMELVLAASFMLAASAQSLPSDGRLMWSEQFLDRCKEETIYCINCIAGLQHGWQIASGQSRCSKAQQMSSPEGGPKNPKYSCRLPA